MGRTVTARLGVDGAFATRRWENPDNIMRITREVGFDVHEFCADSIDPFFMGDKQFQMDLAGRIKQAAQRYGVFISDLYTGMATHRFHGLSHSHQAPRQRAFQWWCEAMDLALAMGTDRLGGHVDAMPVEVWQQPDQYQKAIAAIYAQIRDLAVIAKEKGMGALYIEQMYIPSEVPWTLAQTAEYLYAVNANSDGVPVYITVDVGHQAGQQYGMTGPDLDYLEWTRQYGAVSEVIHLQQTTPDASAHWPFTPEYNEIGKVQIEPVLEALEESHRQYSSNPLCEVLEPVDCNYLILEVIPGSTKSEQRIVEELTISAQYLHQFVPPAGLEFHV